MTKPINAEIKKAAEKLIAKPEYALSQGFVNNFSTGYISIRAHGQCQFEMCQIQNAIPLRTRRSPRLSRGLTMSLQRGKRLRIHACLPAGRASCDNYEPDDTGAVTGSDSVWPLVTEADRET